MFFKWLLVATVIFLGVSSQSLYADSCETVEGYDQILNHRLVMIGEMHGTREVPAYFGDLVCAALDRESSVAVGLELPVAMAPSLDKYLNSDQADALEALLNDPSWSPTFQDGRLSQAMLELIQQLARLKHRHGDRVSVHLIDAPEEYRDGQVSKGQSMASRIRQLADESEADYLFTLTGNFHNRINVPKDQSAASALSDLDPFTVTLNWEEGQAWLCTGSTPDDCGETDLPARESVIETAKVVLIDNDESSWHARLDIPALSSSPPAIQARSHSPGG